MINLDGKELQEEFNKAFGSFFDGAVLYSDDTKKVSKSQLLVENLTLEQLWWLVKFAKHVRGRCRSNPAFNNYMNRNFSPARFQEIPKEYKGKHYMGLKITVGENSSEGEANE